jgi:hypothetical protein
MLIVDGKGEKTKRLAGQKCCAQPDVAAQSPQPAASGKPDLSQQASLFAFSTPSSKKFTNTQLHASHSRTLYPPVIVLKTVYENKAAHGRHP